MARIGFIGVGMMGHGMAANLMRGGHDLAIMAHRNRAPVDDLVAHGAAEAADPAEIAAAEVIFFCLPDSRIVEETVNALVPHLTAGQMIVDTGTSDPGSTKELHARLQAIGVDLVDAPVTGGPPQAEAGDLTTLAGASDEAFALVEPLLAAYSKAVVRMGGPAAGHTAKLLNNFVTHGTATLLALAYGIARDVDVDWAKLHQAMNVGAARSGTFDKMITPAILGDYRGHSFTLANAWKDIRYFAGLAESLSRRTALVDGIEKVLRGANEAGFGDRFVSELLDPEIADRVRGQIDQFHAERLKAITDRVIERDIDRVEALDDVVFSGPWRQVFDAADRFEKDCGYKFHSLPNDYVSHSYIFEYGNHEFGIDIPLWSDGMLTDVQVRLDVTLKDGRFLSEFQDLLIP